MGEATTGSIVCPSCGKGYRWKPELVGKKVKCKCGMAIPVMGPGAAGAFVAPPSIGPVKIRKQDSDGGGTKKLIGIGVFAVFFVVGAILGMKYLGPAVGGKTKQAMKGDDAKILAQIDEENGTEARQWLKANPERHMVMGLSPKQAEYRVNEFYRMGAKRVMAFGAGISTTLAIELPSDPKQRKEIFDWQEKWHKEMFVKPDQDVGQNWLMIQMRM